ncbi:hypothetical protein VPHD81_0108 [Vibrio phage D81]
MSDFDRSETQKRLRGLADNVFNMNDAEDFLSAVTHALLSTVPAFKENQQKLAKLKNGEAEGSMKYATIGEFHENIECACPDCCGDEGNEDCEICEGSGSYDRKVDIAWTTCKDIYKCMHDAKVKDLWPDEQ